MNMVEKLINIQDGVDVSIFGDNLVKGLRQSIFDDFSKEYPNLKIQLFHSGGIFHDRYIMLDYISEGEWNLAQIKRKKNAYIREKVNDPDHAHILSGILKCPCCGKSLYGNIAKAHSKEKIGTAINTEDMEKEWKHCVVNFVRLLERRISGMMVDIVKQ